MHYDLVELKLYKEGLLEDNLSMEIEEHLFSCNACMDEYLSLIDEVEITLAGEKLSQDFTLNLMGEIDNFSKVTTIDGARKKKNKLKNLMLKYTIAASITVVLTASGAFSQPIQTDKYLVEKTRIKKVYTSSDKIFSKFSEILSYKNYDNNRRD